MSSFKVETVFIDKRFSHIRVVEETTEVVFYDELANREVINDLNNTAIELNKEIIERDADIKTMLLASNGVLTSKGPLSQANLAKATRNVIARVNARIAKATA